MKINEFFNNIKKEIYRAQTPKALKVLEKRSRIYKDNILRSDIKRAFKHMALREFKVIKRLIDKKLKEF